MHIDSHQHFWKYNRDEFSWISEEMLVLKRDFLPGDLRPEMQQLNFEGTVAVQARQSLEETGWLLELASDNDFIRGVVGWVDLCSDEADSQLQKFAPNPKFIGVRHVLQDEPDEEFMLRDAFLRGITLLRKYNLTYDLLVFPRHLPFATLLVSKFPDHTFVLDHIAKPLIKERILSPWKQRIEELAMFPNVSCKLSGMVTEASWHGWRKDDFTPYLDVVLNAFGPSRLMIGSDWPVCTVASGYGVTMEIVTDYIATLSPGEREMIVGKNAERIYNLPPYCPGSSASSHS